MITRNGDRYFVEGPITLAGIDALIAEGGRSFEGADVLVDFSRSEAVDSSAVSLMLEWKRRLDGQKRRIAYANLGENLSSLVELYGVAELIPLAE
jgi:phospholipid transport system transporter-binding protein